MATFGQFGAKFPGQTVAITVHRRCRPSRSWLNLRRLVNSARTQHTAQIRAAVQAAPGKPAIAWDDADARDRRSMRWSAMRTGCWSNWASSNRAHGPGRRWHCWSIGMIATGAALTIVFGTGQRKQLAFEAWEW